VRQVDAARAAGPKAAIRPSARGSGSSGRAWNVSPRARARSSIRFSHHEPTIAMNTAHTRLARQPAIGEVPR
jgi:hypothetical protein